MDEATRLQIHAYLLHRMENEERDAFENQFLKDESLLEAERKTEGRFLAGDFVPASKSKLSRKHTLLCLLIGLVTGIIIGLLASIVL